MGRGVGSVLTTPSPPHMSSGVGAGQKDGRTEVSPSLAAHGEGRILFTTSLTVSPDDMDWPLARSVCGCLSRGAHMGFVVKCCGATLCRCSYVTPAWPLAASFPSLPSHRQSIRRSPSTRITSSPQSPLEDNGRAAQVPLPRVFPRPRGDTHILSHLRGCRPRSPASFSRPQRHQVLCWSVAQKLGKEN